MRLPALLTAAWLLAAACGNDATDDAVEAGSTPPSSTPSSAPTSSNGTDGSDDPSGSDGRSEGDEPGSGEPVVGDGSDYQPTLAMADITDRQVHPIDDVVVSAGGLTLGVRYQAAAEPCSGAIATVVEREDSVTVTLETGLNPNAAAMTCIAQVIGYELAVALAEPLGDREVVTIGDDAGADPDTGEASAPPVGDSGSEPPSPDPTRGGSSDGGTGGDGLSAPDAFVGLTLDEAKRLADREGRRWRIGREDDEQYALTADFDADRVTFEVDAGIVTLAVSG